MSIVERNTERTIVHKSLIPLAEYSVNNFLQIFSIAQKPSDTEAVYGEAPAEVFALGDLFAVWSKLKRIEGLKIGAWGDFCKCEIAQAFVSLSCQERGIQRFGAKLCFTCPDEYYLPTTLQLQFSQSIVFSRKSLEETIQELDVLYISPINNAPLAITPELLQKAKHSLVVLSAIPSKKELYEDERVLIPEQQEFRGKVQMALSKVAPTYLEEKERVLADKHARMRGFPCFY
jgi:hypothetical protein